MNHTHKSLGFIGIGLMGQPMSLRLLAAGYRVNVWNRTPEKLNTVIQAGAIPCKSVTDLVAQSDIILLCLADSPIVENIVLQHLLPLGTKHKLLIDLSSTHPETTRQLAQLLHKNCAMDWVDAPVSGGVAGATDGTLAIMAGGNEKSVKIAREVLESLYSQFTHMGKVGSGQITKVCNQMIVSCNVLVIAEMIALAEKSGVDASKIATALTGGFADSKPLQIVAPEMASGIFTPIKWRVKTLLKDLHMATDLASTQSTSTPMTALAAQLMQLHGSHGFLEQDPATLIKLYNNKK
ncbi:2-hydroxy-3-oxopropionate reductase [Methyloprofundus sedimenti]|uniref:2-hydroxy-3-oxopropionate reductase n=1 Tax=Methyloprofundus sedimenti TaxID=1420851 RepID=A0A1V8M6I3_9GAMM|nr:NAD(P)-dependent oxidoreductase [Methyloprofundus sedimenti]OQK17165.1 2-hydroxy-3-oxopropionate reductase [Methyloprofundus sedimenti]